MSKMRVMVVDDDPQVRGIIKDKLGSKDLEVIIAANGREAIRMAETDPPSLIILDIMMPGMSGFDVCERLRANSRTANVPIIFLTARSDRVDREKAMSFGALDYILKPFSPQKLSEKVMEIIGIH
jgi:DNA-binding response OmpR family regulator